MTIKTIIIDSVYFVGLVLIGLSITRLGARETADFNDYPRNRTLAWSDECQGVTNDASNWYIAQYNKLWKFPVTTDLGGNVNSNVKCVGIPDFLKEKGYDHFGAIDTYHGYLFVPLQRNDFISNKLVVFNSKDLSYVSVANLDISMEGSPFSACAINPKDGLLYAANYNDSSSCLFLFYQEISNGKLLLRYLGRFQFFEKGGKISIILKRIQGIKFSSKTGLLYIVSDYGMEGGIYIFNPNSGEKQDQIIIDYKYSGPLGEELQGMTLWDLDGGQSPNIVGQLHLIIINNRKGRKDKVIFRHHKFPTERDSTKSEEDICNSFSHVIK